MKKFNHFVTLPVIFLLAFVLPIAVFAVKEGNGADPEKTSYTISTVKINLDANNERSAIYNTEGIKVYTLKEMDEANKQGLKPVWVLQNNSLIKEKNILADGLAQAKLRLKQLNTEYRAALALRDPAEIEYLSGCIATEKSNITLIKTQMKKIVEEIHRAKELAKI